jgi:membrane protein
MPLFKFVKAVYQNFSNDHGSQMAAALSYTGVFALAPLFIAIIGIAGLIFGQRAVEGTLFSNLNDVVGPSTAASIQHAISHTQTARHGSLALAIGIIGSLFAAAALTSQLQNCFDRVFAAVPDQSGGIKRLVYVKLKNIVVLLIGGLIVAASIAATALLTAVGGSIANHLGMPKGTLQFINLAGSFIIFIVILYLIYRVIPDIKMPRGIVFWTATITALMFLVGKIILGWVIGHNATASAYGAAASIIIIMLWFYYTAQIMLIGAEGMKVYANNHGIIYQPKRYTLKQKTVNVKAKTTLPHLAAEKFASGFTRKNRGE